MGTCFGVKSNNKISSTLSERMQIASTFTGSFHRRSSSSEIRMIQNFNESSEESSNKLVSVDTLYLHKRGVRLEVIKKILNYEHLKKNVLYNFGEHVVENFVKPATKRARISYAEMLSYDPNTDHLVGDCNVFLSHPWSLPIEDVVSSLIDFEASCADTTPKFYFVDWFAINQHQPEEDLTKIAEVIGRCSTLALLGQPWKNPIAISRIWCHFEIACAVRGNTKISFLLPPRQQKWFKQELYSNFNDTYCMMSNIFNKIDSKSAKSSRISDLSVIEQYLEEEFGGWLYVGELVASELRRWIQDIAHKVANNYPKDMRGTAAHANFLYDSAMVLNSQGMHMEEYMKYQEARDIDIQIGDKRGVLMSKNGMAVALGGMGKVKEALALQREVADNYVQEFGPIEQETLVVKYNLGVWLQRAEEWEEAESVLREVLKTRGSKEQTMSEDIKNIMQHLAEVLRDSQKDLQGSITIFDELIAYESNVSGREHEKTLILIAGRGRAEALLGSHAEALAAYAEALPVMYRAWGANDRYVQACQEWLSKSVFAARKQVTS